MIALAARLALLAELLGYGAIGWYLVRSGWSIPGAVALGLGIAVALRIVVTLVPFALVLLHRLLEKRPIAWREFGSAMAKEAWAKSVSFTWFQPFESWVMARDPDPVPSKAIPVLLVHGYVCNRGIWHAMRALLATRIGNPVFTLSLEPPFARIDEYVDQLEARVKTICAGTAQPRVVLVCHSMGGLVARAWIERADGAARVAKLITLGSPHRGTRLARFGLGHNVRQMRYGNDWLATLATEEGRRPDRVPIVSIYTDNDNLVYPPESAELPGATNVRLSGVGHVSLQFSAEAADLIACEVNALAVAGFGAAAA